MLFVFDHYNSKPTKNNTFRDGSGLTSRGDHVPYM